MAAVGRKEMKVWLRGFFVLGVWWMSVGAVRAQIPEDLAIDYSYCGYRLSSEPIPWVPARVVVTPDESGEDSARIQAALDAVAGLPIGENGFRGAVLLDGPEFNLGVGVEIRASGVVVRGRGIEETRLVGHSTQREPLIRVVGGAPSEDEQSRQAILGRRLALGERTLAVAEPERFQVGDHVLVRRPSTAAWIAFLGMDRDRISWKPGTRDLVWERRVVRVTENALELDSGLTMPLDAGFGGGTVEQVDWPERIADVGIENLTMDALGAGLGPLNEDRPWFGVTVENAQDIWVRQVRFEKFSGSAVALWETASRVTIRDCLSLDPRSELGGERRQAFFTMGQQTLFLRCWSESGRRDFGVGHAAAGPNAFVECEAHQTLGASGALGSWSTGTLFDNVTIDGGALRLDHGWTQHSGVGWRAAFSLVWQTDAAELALFRPPGAWNVAYGVWATPIGDGRFENLDEFMSPRSLFVGQLRQRLGDEHPALDSLGSIGRDYPAATNPSLEQVRAFVERSSSASPTLKTTIQQASIREPLWREGDGNRARLLRNPPAVHRTPTTPKKRLSIRDGSLYVGEVPLQGAWFAPTWWRGVHRPQEAASFGPALTRFVPGRMGMGLTDELPKVAEWAVGHGVAVFEHHHGLWYDRRRDDHLRVRRADGDVVAPFYEMPFARSGRGVAWDGLSRYDLTRYNPWYWERLRAFAALCEVEGLALFYQHYFQHNILEAGAHWADFPWRRANNVNETEFPEPPPYIGDKRIFQAHLFYDVVSQRRRALHRDYIRQGLDQFAGRSNVIHSVGAEFTGPLTFVEFWLDTIIDWERETGNDALVCLSCPKDIQDAILADPARAAAVSVIDIRYWRYTDDGELYAPEGGRSLAPRQWARQWRPRPASEASRQRALDEYRERFPEKALLFEGAPVD